MVRKSTLTSILAGKDYEITKGDILFNGESIMEMAPKKELRRAFLAFQYPIEIPGVTNSYFLREALNSIESQKETNL